MSQLAQYVKQALKQIDYRYDIRNVDSADSIDKFTILYLIGAAKSAARGSTIGAGLGALVGSFTGNVNEGALTGAQIGWLPDVVQYLSRFTHRYFTRDENGKLKVWELSDRIK